MKQRRIDLYNVNVEGEKSVRIFKKKKALSISTIDEN